MAALVEQDRFDLWQQWMAELGRQQAETPLLKADIRAAVDSIDAWIDANAQAFNAALPQPARSSLTAKQKAHLFMFVAQRRYDVA